MCSIVKAGALDLARASAAVHSERRTQAIKKMVINHAVNFFRISAVDVPNSDSLASPPKEAPRPELLLSWIKITLQRKTHKSMNKAIVVK